MSRADCAACKRRFASVYSFDAHQRVDYSQPAGSQLACLDPGSLRDGKGKPRFRLNRWKRWGSTAKRPSGSFTGRILSPSQGFRVLTPQNGGQGL